MSGIYGNDPEDRRYENMLCGHTDDSIINTVVKINLEIDNGYNFYFLEATVRIIDNELVEIDVYKLMAIDDNWNSDNITKDGDRVIKVTEEFHQDIEEEALRIAMDNI